MFKAKLRKLQSRTDGIWYWVASSPQFGGCWAKFATWIEAVKWLQKPDWRKS